MNALWNWVKERWGMAFEPYHSIETGDVQAEQVTETRSIITPNGPLTATDGQWEVHHADGRVERVDEEEFDSKYEAGASVPAAQKSTTEDPTGDEDSAPDETVTPSKTASDSSEESDKSPADTSAESDKTSEEEKDDGPPL